MCEKQKISHLFLSVQSCHSHLLNSHATDTSLRFKNPPQRSDLYLGSQGLIGRGREALFTHPPHICTAAVAGRRRPDSSARVGLFEVQMHYNGCVGFVLSFCQVSDGSLAVSTLTTHVLMDPPLFVLYWSSTTFFLHFLQPFKPTMACPWRRHSTELENTPAYTPFKPHDIGTWPSLPHTHTHTLHVTLLPLQSCLTPAHYLSQTPPTVTLSLFFVLFLVNKLFPERSLPDSVSKSISGLIWHRCRKKKRKHLMSFISFDWGYQFPWCSGVM